MSMEESQEYDSLYRDTVHLSNNLINPGYPENWNSSTVIIPGIAQNNRINLTKLEEFNNMSYSRTKTLFQISHEYIFFFENASGIINVTIDETGQTKCMFGYAISVNSTCDPQLELIDYENLIKIKRVAIYNSTLVTLVVYQWS